MHQRPTFQDVLKAKAVIAGYLSRTPLYRYSSLCQLLGCEVYVKHENHQPVGAFKVRGGINLMSQLSEDERRRGVIAASTGNHGQSVAYAARLFGVEATIVVPEGANPGKVETMRGLGAHIIFHGRDFDQAREHCEALALERGYRYVHSGNEPLLIAGVGTETLEVLEDQPDIEVIIVPIGGGSGASGACIAAKAINPAIQVIGVQAEKAPAAYRSWKERQLVEDKMETAAEGLATRTAFALPQSILWDLLDDFVLVSEEEIRRAIVLYLEKTHNLAEGAGAAPLAAAVKMRGRLRGRKVALILSGGNLSLAQLRVALHGGQREETELMSTLEELVARLLTEQGLIIAVAESCTGGLIAHQLTNVPGSSAYFVGGVVAYSNEVKEQVLGVSGETLSVHGAVSEETAREMACGARRLFDTDVAISTAGIAGPTGGTPQKPVGLVYVALAAQDLERCERHLFQGRRLRNKWQTSEAALEMLRQYLEARRP